MEEPPYRHILYYSPSHIQQLFFDRIDESTKVVRESESQKSRRLMASLRVFVTGGIEGEKQSRENVMDEVNQSEEYIQTKHVVNNLLKDESIPRIKELDHNDIAPMYRFSCECQILGTDDVPDDSKMVEVVGKEGDIKFRGITSLDNWSSLSDTLMAIRNDIPYPLEGIVQFRDFNDHMLTEEMDGFRLEYADCDVNYIFVCQPSREEFQRWMNRRDLLGDYYEKYQ